MPYPFDQIFAADPERPEMVATNAPVVIFAPGDETKTPLTLTALNGLPLENPVIVNDRGFGPAFIADLDQVAWEGGGLTGLMASYRGLKDDAETAARAAVVAREAAEEAARNTVAPTAEVVAEALTSEGPAREAVNAAINAGTANLALKPDNGARAVGKGELVLNARDYGAKGDGVTDDSDALQEWINAGGTTLSNGTYRTTKTLTVARNNTRLAFDNATVVADTVNMVALLVSASKASISVHIDGNAKASQAIKVTGDGCRIYNSTIENLSSDTITARGIEAVTTGGVTIENCVIRNIYSKPNGVTGDNPGSSRAIVVTSPQPATKYSVIRNNIIENIFGEEGDAITVQFMPTGGTTKFLSGKVSIRNNQFRTASRRFIKIQACDVNVDSNVLEFDLNTTEPILAGGAIAAIQSDNINIINNVIYPNPLNSPIAVTGHDGDYSKGIVVAGNTVLQGDSQASIGIYMTNVDAPVIKGNVIIGGTEVAIAVGNTRGALIDTNTIKGGSAGVRPIQSVSGERTVIRLNSVMSPRGGIRNLSTNPVTELNYEAVAV